MAVGLSAADSTATKMEALSDGLCCGLLSDHRKMHCHAHGSLHAGNTTTTQGSTYCDRIFSNVPLPPALPRYYTSVVLALITGAGDIAAGCGAPLDPGTRHTAMSLKFIGVMTPRLCIVAATLLPAANFSTAGISWPTPTSPSRCSQRCRGTRSSTVLGRTLICTSVHLCDILARLPGPEHNA